jgi:hypothetical protein
MPARAKLSEGSRSMRRPIISLLPLGLVWEIISSLGLLLLFLYPVPSRADLVLQPSVKFPLSASQLPPLAIPLSLSSLGFHLSGARALVSVFHSPPCYASDFFFAPILSF